MQTNDPLVHVQNIHKAFGAKVAVEDVSFTVQAGEVFGLLGPNGAGKTTTIRMILDIFKPDRGTIEVLGGGFNQERADRIGYMPEERGLYPDMRVLDCLIHLGSLKGLKRKEAKRRAIGYLERLGLAEHHRTRIQDLSRGMTQKVQVITAVLHQPTLLIIDEPFANLDPINAQLVRDIFLEIRERGGAVMMTSHQMNLVEAICDRIALIHQGKVVLDGTIAQVRRQFARDILHLHGTGQLPNQLPDVQAISQKTLSDWYLTLEPKADSQKVLSHLLTLDGFTLDRFEVDTPSLDEIFVQVVRT